MAKKILVKEYRFKNGLQLLVSPRNWHPVVCCMIWYRVGSRDEGRGETGVSHFLEHMMFKGTKKLRKGDVDRMTARLGGSNNAFTNTDYTAYYFNLASDRWMKALDIEAERMKNCKLLDKEFLPEKNVVFEELKMGRDDPWRDLFQEVQTAAYSVHPYHHPVIGWESDLRALDRETMLRYYRRHYSPDNAVLVVAGDVNPRNVYLEVRKRFASITASKVPSSFPEEPPQRGEKRITLHRPTNLNRFAVCYKTCRVAEPADFVFDVISVILTQGKNSRFYRKLVHAGLATHVSTENDPRIDPGLFWAGVESTPRATQEKIEEIVFSELEENLHKKLVAPSEIQKAKKLIATSFHFQQETASEVAEKIGRWAVQASHRGLNRYLKDIESVTAARIRETAKKYFRKENRTVGWSLPSAKS